MHEILAAVGYEKKLYVVRKENNTYTESISELRAPDGSCILTNSADNVLRVYNLPPEIYSYNWDMLPELVSSKQSERLQNY